MSQIPTQTPGPWSVYRPGFKVQNSDLRVVVADVQNAADLPLIAASPELFKAVCSAAEILRNLRTWFKMEGMSWCEDGIANDVIRECESAIAKAEESQS